jgi:hypothetical protein
MYDIAMENIIIITIHFIIVSVNIVEGQAKKIDLE